MKQITENINNQILSEMTLNQETIEKLNSFFKETNDFLKGDKTTRVYVFVDSVFKVLYTNLLDSEFNRTTPLKFKTNLIEYLNGFSDSQELMIDIILLLDKHGLITVNQDLRLILFNRLYNSGCFCYTPLDSNDFKNNYDYIELDLKVIGDIVSQDSLTEINDYLKVIMTDFYLSDSHDLKYMLTD